MRVFTLPYEVRVGIGYYNISAEERQKLKNEIDKHSPEGSGVAALPSNGETFDKLKAGIVKKIQPMYNSKLSTLDAWSLKYATGQRVSPHNHIVDGSICTYSYVIDDGGHDTAIQFYDVNYREVIKEVPTTTGMIIFFSNYLNHGTRIHEGSNRYVLAGNIVNNDDIAGLRERYDLMDYQSKLKITD